MTLHASSPRPVYEEQVETAAQTRNEKDSGPGHWARAQTMRLPLNKSATHRQHTSPYQAGEEFRGKLHTPFLLGHAAEVLM